nr:hypothetical protein CFP56_69422 [Quercus suber]
MSSEGSARVRSCEEKDELQRSTKKVKESHIPGGVCSYRDKLIGEIPGAYCQAFEFNNVHIDENLMSDDEVKELFEGLVAEDLDHVIAGGPWFIGEHFLSIRPWSANFRPSTVSVSSVAIWARLLELQIEYYHEDMLKDIGASIGPDLRIDTHSALGSKRRYARVCVQVDLLVLQVQDEKEAQRSLDTQPKPSVEEYGPWTVVSRRKSTTRNNSKGVGRGLSQSDTTSDSFWAKWPSWAYSADTIQIGNSKSASDRKCKAHYGDFGPSGVKSKDTWNSPSHKVTLAFATVSSNVPILDMGLKCEACRLSSTLGNLSRGQDLPPIGCNSGPNQSGSDPCHGLVRLGAPHCLEPHLSLYAIKPSVGVSPINGSGMVELEESLVGVPHRHPNTFGRESICKEKATVEFTRVNLARIRVGSGTHRKKNVGGGTNYSESLGQ